MSGLHLHTSLRTSADSFLWHVVTAWCAVRPIAVANSIEMKGNFLNAAAEAFRVPSQIAQQNQPPGARPTAALLSRPRSLFIDQTAADD